jgi:L-iditol 2-dehydrogenase
MRSAHLYGIRDLRIDHVPVPEPGPREILVRVEACGLCATDSRKYEIGVSDGHYPFNPGHEWLGRVAAVGQEVEGWSEGERVYGDIYGGYADFAIIPVDPIPWSRGPLKLPADLPAERAIFVEPLADCLHAVHDQARLRAGDEAVVVAAGVMGLKIVAEAALLGARVLVVEPREDRRALALTFGAEAAVPAAGWRQAAQAWSREGGAHAVFLTIGDHTLVNDCIAACRPGGRVVLFAGFGDRSTGSVDFNSLHYREVALIGSEWIGTPPNQCRGRYDEALARLMDQRLPFEKLVTGRCGFSDLEAAIVRRQTFSGMKTMFVPEAQS